LTQQCTDPAKKAYGGFKSAEASTQYWSIDAGRCIPALLKAYALTNTSSYLDAAKLAGYTFLYTMQHEPANLGFHDKYYGGFANYVTITDTWDTVMSIENLYCLIGLKMLADTYDTGNASRYNSMMSDLVGFLRDGFEQLYLYYQPPPSGQGKWYRVGINDTQVYDDPVSFALLGLYTYEGWSVTCKRVYNFVQTIRASAEYPAYNPAICWPGYIDVVTRFPASPYYDAITSGILWRIRVAHDKPSLALSMQVIQKHYKEFMYWGPLFTDYSPITAQKAMANNAWLSQLFLNYSDPVTNMSQLLNLNGEGLILYPIQQAADQVSYGEALDIQGLVTLGTAGEIVIEPGYMLEDHITVYTFLPIRVHDKVRRAGVDYEVLTVQQFDLNGDPEYYKSVCRRLLGQ